MLIEQQETISGNQEVTYRVPAWEHTESFHKKEDEWQREDELTITPWYPQNDENRLENASVNESLDILRNLMVGDERSLEKDLILWH